MINKEAIKEFLKPDWRKITLTVLLLFILYLFPIYPQFTIYILPLLLYIGSCAIYFIYDNVPRIGKVLIILCIAIVFIVILLPSFLFILPFLVFGQCSGDVQSYPSPIPQKWKTCSMDSNCTIVQLKCCPLCFPPGESVNEEGKINIEKWKKSNCGRCCAMASCVPPEFIYVPVCVNNLCTLKEYPHSALKSHITKNESEECEEIQDYFYKDLCYLDFVDPDVNISIDKAVEICDKKIHYSNFKDKCYSQVAWKITNRLNPTDEGLRLCEEKLGVNWKYCFNHIMHLNITNFDRILEKCKKHSLQCCSELAYATASTHPYKALALCHEQGVSCDNTAITRIAKAIAKTNPDKAENLCGEIMSVTSRESCYNSIACAIASTNYDRAVSICNWKVKSKDSCYFNLAKTVAKIYPDKIPELCEKISHKGSYNIDLDLCYEIGIKALIPIDLDKAILFCEKIADAYPKRKSKCFFEIAISINSTNLSKAESMCEKVKYVDIKDNCYLKISQSIALTNPNKAKKLCNKIRSLEDQNKCYLFIAKNTTSTNPGK